MTDYNKLRVFEAFAGIGAQEKALKLINKDYQIIYISEWDAYALIAKDAIHNGNLTQDQIEEFLIKNNLVDYKTYLKNKTYSLDGKQISKKLLSKSEQFLKRLVIADYRTKNLGSITQITANDIKGEFDLLTYSFPCQDLSIASMGKDEGINQNFQNRSTLLWEIERILKEMQTKENYKMPKFLLLENVRNLLSKKHLPYYQKWLSTLEEDLNYLTFTFELSARWFGNPQTRTRVFALSIHKSYVHIIEQINNLIKNVTGKTKDEKFAAYIINNYTNFQQNLSDEQWNRTITKHFLRLNYDDKNLSNEAKDSLIKLTKSRIKIVNNSNILNKKSTTKIGTITTKQDRFINPGIVNFDNDYDDYLNYRYLTPRETLLIMGFSDQDYERLKYEKFLTNNNIYKQAGNSIVIQCLKAIFNFIYSINKETNHENHLHNFTI